VRVEERQEAARLGRYGIRCPLVLDRLAWDETSAEVVYSARPSRRDGAFIVERSSLHGILKNLDSDGQQPEPLAHSPPPEAAAHYDSSSWAAAIGLDRCPQAPPAQPRQKRGSEQQSGGGRRGHHDRGSKAEADLTIAGLEPAHRAKDQRCC
jgi:hypothetical protein